VVVQCCNVSSDNLIEVCETRTSRVQKYANTCYKCVKGIFVNSDKIGLERMENLAVRKDKLAQ
jgi:hypothetical protein